MLASGGAAVLEIEVSCPPWKIMEYRPECTPKYVIFRVTNTRVNELSDSRPISQVLKSKAVSHSGREKGNSCAFTRSPSSPSRFLPQTYFTSGMAAPPVDVLILQFSVFSSEPDRQPPRDPSSKLSLNSRALLSSLNMAKPLGPGGSHCRLPQIFSTTSEAWCLTTSAGRYGS